MATRLTNSYHEEYTLSQAYSRAYGKLWFVVEQLLLDWIEDDDARTAWTARREEIARELEDALSTVIFDASLRSKLARR